MLTQSNFSIARKATSKLLMASALVSLLVFSSCSQRIIDFTVISSKNHDLGFDKSKGMMVKGKSMGFFGIGANVKAAVDDALEQAGPSYDILIDGKLSTMVYPFYSGYVTEGIAVQSGKMRSELGEEGFEKWCLEHDIFNPEDYK